MRKNMVLGLLIVTVFSAAAATAAVAQTAQPVDPRHAELAARLPELDVPQALPATIEDASMLEAWVRLYNHQEPITLWDGSTTTGRELAEYLVVMTIPVVWDTEDVCRGSCSVRYCRKDGTCSYDDGQPGVEPILVHVLYADDVPSLVLILAHEIFHRTQPFGAVPDTRFEEYWAFKLESQITPEGAMSFDGFDPMVPAELDGWLVASQLDGYLGLPQYPAVVMAVAAAQEAGM